MNNNKSYGWILKKLLSYFKEDKFKLLLCLVLVFIANGLMLIGPRYSGLAIDALGTSSSSVNFNKVIYYALWMLFFYIASSLISYLLTWLSTRLTQKITKRMRQDTYNKILDLPLSYIDTHQAGDLVSRISYDLDLVSQSLTHDIIQILASIITVVGSLVMMFSISTKLSLMFLIVVPITVLFTLYRIKKTRPLYSYRSKKLGEMNGFVEEILNGQKTIQMYDKADYFSLEFKDINKTSIKAYYQADYQGALNGPSVMLISNLCLALVSLFGSLGFIRGEFTIGALAAFILYSRRFSGPINEIANIITEIQSSLSAARRVFVLMEQDSEPEDIEEAITLTDIKGLVEFEHVDFGYEEHKPILKDVSFKAQPGELIAIVGPTGAGKTTIINLLMRFYDVNNGTIYIDNHPIETISRNSLRESFSMVLQDTWLFKGTLLENLTYGSDEVTLDQVNQAIDAANLRSFVDSLPMGLETEIEDGASNLSAGQRQLLTIARAMLLNNSMLILDEATSNVDSQTELLVQEAMNNLMKNKTSFVIAHRLSTIVNADKILLIKDGRIEESGKHDELLHKGGAYAKLYQAQFE